MESSSISVSSTVTERDSMSDRPISVQHCDSPEQWKSRLQQLSRKDGPPVILVDMDNTLADWESQFHTLMHIHNPDIQIVPPSNRTEFKIELNYEDEFRDPILHLTSFDQFWLSMNPTEGAIEALTEMTECGLAVFIVTTPDSKHTARSAHEKIQWIEQHLGPEWKSKTIVTSDKTLVKGDILIDDKPDISMGLLRPSWTHVLFTQPYNIKTQLRPRLEHWNQWGETIYDVLLKRQQENRLVLLSEGGMFNKSQTS